MYATDWQDLRVITKGNFNRLLLVGARNYEPNFISRVNRFVGESQSLGRGLGGVVLCDYL